MKAKTRLLITLASLIVAALCAFRPLSAPVPTVLAAEIEGSAMPAALGGSAMSASAGSAGIAPLAPKPTRKPTATPTNTPAATPTPTGVTPTPTVTSPPANAGLIAFPGAEGFGAHAVGGRGGQVLEVTNLEDSGPGSLRACVQAAGPRTCVFRTGGTISLNAPLIIANPYITIAGQTAPGGGILLRNDPAYASEQPGLRVATHDVILRYLTLRTGPLGWGDAMSVDHYKAADVYNVIIDHSSFSWGVDEVVSTWYAAHDVTIQWSIIAEPLDCTTHPEGCHSKGVLLGGYSDGGTGTGAYNISYHHNLVANYHERGPMIRATGLVDVVNNVSYNARGAMSHVYLTAGATNTPANFVGNYYKRGPVSPSDKYEIRVYSDRTSYAARLYVEGNIGPHRTSDNQPEMDAVYPASQVYLVAARHAAAPVTTSSAADAYEQVLAGAGNSGGLDASGASIARRDAVDQRVIAEVRNGGGKVIDAPGASSCVGLCRGGAYVLTAADTTRWGITAPLDPDGWPLIEAGAGYDDRDHDGMADAWELAHGLDPDVASSNLDSDADGYTDLEEYLNTSAPQ